LAVACHQALAGWPGHPASQPGTPGAMELGFYYRAVPTPSTEGPATVFLPQRLPQRSTLCPHLVSTEPDETSVSSSDDVQASFFYLPCHAHHSAVPTDRPEKARGKVRLRFPKHRLRKRQILLPLCELAAVVFLQTRSVDVITAVHREDELCIGSRDEDSYPLPDAPWPPTPKETSTSLPPLHHHETCIDVLDR